MRIILASSSLYALESLRVLEGAGHEIVSFITMPDRPKGRSATEKPNPFREWVVRERAGIPCHAPNSNEELVAVLDEMQPDLVVTIAYGRLVKPEALARPKYGWLNLHFSKLPRWRGAAPVQRSILAGDLESGVTVFKLDSGMDTGPIYSTIDYRFKENESATNALESMARLGAEELVTAVVKVEAGMPPTPQQGESTMAPKIEKSELELRKSLPSELTMRQIRAFTSAPGVWLKFKGKRLIITKASPVKMQISSDHLIDYEGSLLLGTSDQAIKIERLIPEGKREMSGGEFVRGRELKEATPIE